MSRLDKRLVTEFAANYWNAIKVIVLPQMIFIALMVLENLEII